MGQLDFEREPINYGRTPFHDPIVDLQKRLANDEAKLRYDDDHGYLRSLLELLDIKPSTQMLVKSKTSSQLRKISPMRPRAIYFNDHTYVGWVQDGDVLEVITTDPVQGAVFYTIPQTKPAAEGESPKFNRDRSGCISCHATSRTQGVPGGLVRSLFTDAQGQPHYGAGSFTTDHRSPFKERWGGWYVTGTHGAMRHMGNVVSSSREKPTSIDREVGANISDLSDHFDEKRYLTGHSDIVALMVLEHQTQMHNYLTLASYETRSARHNDDVMNTALERPPGTMSDTTKRRIATAGDKVLRSLLFVDEFKLTSPVQGSSDFAKEFVALGPSDKQGRSLRDFDLTTRMFKYPCSYLIYSPSFDALPSPVKRHVIERLHAVLTGEDESEEFSHLTTADRTAIFEILSETKPGLWDDKLPR